MNIPDKQGQNVLSWNNTLSTVNELLNLHNKENFTHIICPSNFQCNLVLSLLASKLNTAPVFGVTKIVSSNTFSKQKFSSSLIQNITSKEKIHLLSLSPTFSIDQLRLPPFAFKTRKLDFASVEEDNEKQSFLTANLNEKSSSNDNNTENKEQSKYIDESSKNTERIVCIGRGAMESKEEAEEFAKLISAKIGCTRPVFQSGTFPKSSQIGQTGVSVSPKLYFGLGVSGAVQHLSGISQASKIILVNNDKKLDVSFCDYVVNGDANEVLKLMNDFLKCKN